MRLMSHPNSATSLRVSAIVLTYNRQELAIALVDELKTLGDALHEIILVDNNSSPPVRLEPEGGAVPVQLVSLPQNVGAAGRNEGIARASGDIVVTLDDDISGLSRAAIDTIRELFRDSSLAGVCFKVVDLFSGLQINWCHHYPMESYGDSQFHTNEISEGAVAFRREYVMQAGMYPASFFISHEGPDLAFRLWNRGYKLIYDGRIAVKHSTAEAGRASWRRYYFDTRNVLWLAARNYPFLFGVRKISLQVAAMGVYSLRDGFLRYWFKALFDGVRGLPQALREREKPTASAMGTMRTIDSHRPGFWSLVRKRLRQRTVRI